jgi:hypothetical protein
MIKKLIILIAMIGLLSVPSIVFSKQSNETKKPSQETIESSVKRNIANLKGNKSIANDNILLKDFQILNEYSLKKEGEIVYCYDVKCKYKPEAYAHIDGFPYLQYAGIIELVKRGNSWYNYN